MPVVLIPAVIAGILNIFSGIINIFMQLPNSVKLVVFYAVYWGLGINIPGTTLSIGNTLISPIVSAAFGVVHIPMDYQLFGLLLGVILFLIYANFMNQLGGN